MAKHDVREVSKAPQFVFANVAKRAFGKPVDEYGPFSKPEQDDRPEPTRLAFIWTSDPLLDDTAAEVRVDKPPMRFGNRSTQNRVLNPMLSGESHKPSGLEDFHVPVCRL